MNPTATNLKNRLSLRQPLREALDIVADLADDLELKKDVDLPAELAKVRDKYPTCTDFERAFPSLCFAIATGVGKTRLMGACIAYLYLHKGLRNFFVLAPNLTLYEKLIKDFGDPGHPKYVFNGIAEFVHTRPVVITGENYAQQGALFAQSEIRINVFNIAKFNADSKVTRSGGLRGGGESRAPRIKRLSEYLGQSYFSYLAGLDDLVILMDEAHRYHADASKTAINELRPVLGLELTATPIDEKGQPFRNVVYEYSLAKALDDGLYVKAPAIATRKNYSTKGKSDEEIERDKLEDGITVHEEAKAALELYARSQEVRRVKPFVLVVCRDTTHARQTIDYLQSDQFYEGAYRGKVLQIDSTTKNDDAIARQFLSLEAEDNPIELVIHVNMLKEGWDVTNLYTIVPLRAANAAVLIEQTIGRGLRLPYNGERVGEDRVDKLTVIAHDNFEKVIEAAKDPNSVLNKVSFVELPEHQRAEPTVVVKAETRTEAALRQEQTRVSALPDEPARQRAQTSLDAQKAILDVLPTLRLSDGVGSTADLERADVKQVVLEKVAAALQTGQLNLLAPSIAAEAEQVYQRVVRSYRENTIDMPRMDLVQETVQVGFDDFDLDVSSGFDLRALSEEIMVVGLKDNRVDILGVRAGANARETPARQLIVELTNYPEVDYEDNAALLHKLAGQAVTTLEVKLDDRHQLPLLVRQHRKLLAARIYDQMKRHLRVSEPEYLIPNVLPFVKIEPWNFTALAKDAYREYHEPVSPLSLIPKLVFRGFEKAGHFEYKFDSKAEKDFAYVLEHDRQVLKWLRPAERQFRLYWANNARQYRPDFVVETDAGLFLVEVKAANEIASDEVQDKARAGVRYCQYATEFTAQHGGKRWRYLLIPHDAIATTSSFDFLVNQFTG